MTSERPDQEGKHLPAGQGPTAAETHGAAAALSVTYKLALAIGTCQLPLQGLNSEPDLQHPLKGVQGGEQK